MKELQHYCFFLLFCFLTVRVLASPSSAGALFCSLSSSLSLQLMINISSNAATVAIIFSNILMMLRHHHHQQLTLEIFSIYVQFMRLKVNHLLVHSHVHLLIYSSTHFVNFVRENEEKSNVKNHC